MRTDANRSRMHVVMPPIDKSTFYTQNYMINVESLAAKTSRWEVLQCPAVPKAERIVEFPFVQVGSSISDFNGNVVNQLKAPFIFARSFALSCPGLIFTLSCCRMVLFSSTLVLAILILDVDVELFTIHWCCAFLIVNMFNQLFNSCAGVVALFLCNTSVYV